MNPTTNTEAGAVADVAAMLTEAQRWVPGYEGRYYLDKSGEVFSLARTFERSNRGRAQTVRVPGRRLVQCLNRNGYPFVRLYINNKGRTFEVHRIVCRAFHGEPPEGYEAAHSNGDRTNCSEGNVSWKTRPENMADKRAHGTLRTGEAVPGAKLTSSEAVAIYRRSIEGETPQNLASEYGVDESAVRKIRRGELWAADTLAVRQHLEQGATAS